MKMQSQSIIIVILYLFTGIACEVEIEDEKQDDHCDLMMKKITLENKAIATDNTPTRLHYTWVSQECEVRAGPKYVIRKYSFFRNGTFLLLLFHYAEESCSIATYDVVARGSIKILSPSIQITGATRATVQLDSVHLIPFNRQVAHKFGRRMNASCGGGVDTRWRPYSAQLIYERPIDFPLINTSLHVHDLNSNSLQSRLPRFRKQYTPDCLESFGIEFSELRLLRVEVKGTNLIRNTSRSSSASATRVELFLGGLARNLHSQRTEPRPNRLQATSLVRADTAVDCPICSSVFRATDYSPPLFHQAPSLPAVIGGLWLSIKCESVDGGFWSRRFFRIYLNDNRWFARWTYYADYHCSNSLYTIAAAGTYIQRAVRASRSSKGVSPEESKEPSEVFTKVSRLARIHENQNFHGYHQALQDTEEFIVLGRNRRRRKITRNERIVPASSQNNFMPPSGTTELQLRVLESLLIPLDKGISMRECSATNTIRELKRSRRNEARAWLKNCAPRTVEAPATLSFKAKVSLDWNGDYRLLLASWQDDLWEAPLYRCSATASRYYFQGSWQEYLALSQKENWYDRLNRYRQHWFSSSFASCSLEINWGILFTLWTLQSIF